MQGIRIQPAERGYVFLVDLICDCGRNGLDNRTTGEASFKHRADLDPGSEIFLDCRTCTRNYRIASGDGMLQMDAIQAWPSDDLQAVVVIVICDCGRRQLTDRVTREKNSLHRIGIQPGPENPDVILDCEGCGNAYSLMSHVGHIHVNRSETAKKASVA